MDLETLRYEMFPFIYGIGGIVVFLIRPDSSLLKVSGVLLFVAAVSILRLRWKYRRALYVQVPSPETTIRQEAASTD